MTAHPQYPPPTPRRAVATWAADRPSPRAPAPSVRQVVAAAIALADAEGLAAVSMRRIAADLGSGTTSLYRLLDGREELVDRMVDEVLGETLDWRPTGRWREDLARAARALRGALLRHPWLGARLAGRPALGPNSLDRYELALRAAAPLTGRPARAAAVVDTVTAYVLGATAGELAGAEAGRSSGLDAQQWRASVGPYLAGRLATGRYPHFARVVSGAEGVGGEERFEFGLACVLAGVEARVADVRADAGRRPGGPRPAGG